MKRLAVLIGLSTAVIGAGILPALAACDDLWYSRNSIMDDAGYCFGTTLGKAIFDNSDCHTKQPNLTSINKARVVEIQQYEWRLGCKVNTNRTNLDIYHFEIRKTLGTQPLNDGHESSCIGYNGEKEIPLYSDMNRNSQIIGYIKYGDSLGDDHVAYSNQPPKWGFVSGILRDGVNIPVLGWAYDDIGGQCDSITG